MLIEFENRGSDREFRLPASHGGEPLAFANTFRQVFAAVLFHFRLGIKQIHLRWGT